MATLKTAKTLACVLGGVWALVGLTTSRAADAPLETVEVQGSRAQVRKQIQSFVSQVTRKDGELIGRWRDLVCPFVAGLSDPQDEFIRHRILEVEARVRKREATFDRQCPPNLFVILTDDVDHVLAQWKERDPGMFRWKDRAGVSHSAGAGPVKVWHNAIEVSADDRPMDATSNTGPPKGKLKDSRIAASAQENITGVVVLVDAGRVGKVSLAQVADYIAMVSLSQIDLSADVGKVNTILQVFADNTTTTPPAALTDWDYAFLKALYRTSYSPLHQRMDLSARMSRDLAPR